MRKKILSLIACAAAACCALTGCAGTGSGSGKVPGKLPSPPTPGEFPSPPAPLPGEYVPAQSSLLSSPKAARPLDRLEWSELKGTSFDDLLAAVQDFSYNFTYAAGSEYFDGTSNAAVSPLSVYMALALAAECSRGQTQTELLGALNVSYDTLIEQIPNLYRALNQEFLTNRGDVKGVIDMTNSIWVNDGTRVSNSCIDSLAEYYYCYSYAADFAKKNKNANAAVREFIKENTHGLIDKDFALPTETVFALINTLYLKDVWRDTGDDIFVTDNKYDFTRGDGTKTQTRLMSGFYNIGKPYEDDEFTSFYTQTDDGIVVTFMMPKAGYSLEDIFTAQNLQKLDNIQYVTTDTQKMERYHTRCLFPAFNASFDYDIAPVIASRFGVRSLFNADECDLTGLTADDAFCSSVQHVTELKVDRKGIEGAAVTVELMTGTAGPGEDPYKDVYLNYIVNGSFAYTVSYRGFTLFSGVVNNIEVL